MASSPSLSASRVDELVQEILQFCQRRPRRFRPARQLTADERDRLAGYLRDLCADERTITGLRTYLRQSKRKERRQDVVGLLANLRQTASAYEEPAHQNMALDLIPEKVYAEIGSILLKDPSIGAEDALAISLVRWFKFEFMKWVDPVKCPQCGGTTKGCGVLQGGDVNEEERQGGAARVELYQCVEAQLDGKEGCGGMRRFPRYNNLPALMQSREGRCGEFANLFTLFLVAVGLDARYVWNSEDHVWPEYWSDSLGHWVHLDPCEAAWNKPLLYELGWGKKQAYCIAVGRSGIEDVSRCYVDDWSACWGRRRRFDEEDLSEIIESTTRVMRAPWTEELRMAAAIRDAKQSAWKRDVQGRRRQAAEESGALTARQSGTKEWRAVREELGLTATGVNTRVLERGDVIFSMDLHHDTLSTFGSAALARTLSSDQVQLSLTPCVPSRSGSAFTPTIRRSSTSFIAEMTFRITKTSPSAEGADGMAFVFLSAAQGDGHQTLLGSGGAGLGYGGVGARDDWVVELDTYQSQDSCADPPTPHISLHSPPNPHHRFSLACTQQDSIPDITDASWRTLKIQYDSSDSSVVAWLSDDEDSTVTSRTTPNAAFVLLWQAKLPTSSGRTLSYRLGITAATGGFAQAHEVRSWTVWSAYEEGSRTSSLGTVTNRDEC